MGAGWLIANLVVIPPLPRDEEDNDEEGSLSLNNPGWLLPLPNELNLVLDPNFVFGALTLLPNLNELVSKEGPGLCVTVFLKLTSYDPVSPPLSSSTSSEI